MGWVRTKALTTEHPPAPSLVWWLFAGALMAIAGVLLFLLHAFGAIKTLSEMDIWWVSLAPAGCWLLVFCLRCYLWDRELKVHQFLQKEAEYGQQQWEAWAGRYQAVLGSTVLLPDNITAAVWGKERPQQYGLTRRIDYLPAEAPAHMGVMRILLASVEERVQRLPAELPLHVTLVTENPSPELTSSFNNLWKEHIPGRAVPDEITVTRATVYHHDRCRIPLKQPVAMSTCQPVSLKHRPVMGTHATDVNGQVLLRLSTDNPEEVRGWLPGGDLHADLMALLHVWLGAHLDVRMQLCVARHLLPDARLSCNAEQTAQVGRTAVLRPLNAQQNRNDIITIHLGRFQRVRENIQRRKNDEDGDYRW